MLVEVWSDIVCPWCYIGKRRFERALAGFEHAGEVDVRWRSFELDPWAPFRRSKPMAAHLAAKYGMTLDQAKARLEDMNKLAAADGLVYDLANTQGGNTFDAHRLIHLGNARGLDTGATVKEGLLKAYFTDLRPISEPEVLLEIGVTSGLDPVEVADLLATDRFATEVRQDEAEAAALGSTGVPFFVFDRAFTVPGAQDSSTFLITLRRTWERSHPGEPEKESSSAGNDDACAF
jgi:predicted DsbA family dithiol-disulfide isomerase